MTGEQLQQAGERVWSALYRIGATEHRGKPFATEEQRQSARYYMGRLQGGGATVQALRDTRPLLMQLRQAVLGKPDGTGTTQELATLESVLLAAIAAIDNLREVPATAPVAPRTPVAPKAPAAKLAEKDQLAQDKEASTDPLAERIATAARWGRIAKWTVGGTLIMASGYMAWRWWQSQQQVTTWRRS